MSNESGIKATGAYYAADHRYRCQSCGKPMEKGGEVFREYDKTYVVQICKCGNKMILEYERR